MSKDSAAGRFEEAKPSNVLTVGDLIWFEDEIRPYTVQAVSSCDRWVIATKPFHVRRTVIYTVIDTRSALRGRDNYGGLGYETPEDCERAAAMFANGQAEHSRRHPPIYYSIRKVERAGVDLRAVSGALRPPRDQPVTNPR